MFSQLYLCADNMSTLIATVTLNQKVIVVILNDFDALFYIFNQINTLCACTPTYP